MSWACKSITSLFITFWCMLLNPPGKEVYRDELFSSAKRVRVKSRWVPAEPWLSSDSSLWRLAPLRWLPRLLPFSLHVILLLWGICKDFPMLWLSQALSLCDPGWLLLSWFPNVSCWSLAVTRGPWAAASLGSGERSRRSSSHRQGPVTKGHGQWYKWEKGNFAELWLQQHSSLGGVSWDEIVKWCSKHLRGK